jgi:two-component system sensor histidine kinase KdpD
MADPDADRRPDPDALLARVEAEEARERRGRLKIFFGASPGVGKTFAMLTAARRLREQGSDVAVGLVETHGRAETTRLLDGLELLPRREVEHRGRKLREFDLDAALARRPAVLLVDELAHTNAPGSRHPKRWQDVQELIAAGIDVWTTVNVQHLETLNDIVGGITGVRVQETLPDRIFDGADEIVLVDLPPDELLERMREGKVYIPEQAERAAKNFFRKGNLLALRELALRRTADRVDDEMRTYRRDYVGGQVWRAQPAVLVAIGPQAGEDTVVRNAARLAGALDARWHAVYVETPKLSRLPDERRREILKTLALASSLGAQVATVSAPDVASALVGYAREHNLASVVLGRPARRPQGWRRFIRHPGSEIARRAPDIDVILIARDAAAAERQRSEPGQRRPIDVRGYAIAAALTALATAIALPLLPYFDLANIVMVFLLAVVAAAMLAGRGPAVFAAIANVLAFDVFFVPPRFSFAVSDVQYLFTFVVMLIVGLVIGGLTGSLRFQVQVARQREARAQRLTVLARELSGALTDEQIAEIGDRTIEASLNAKATMLLPDERDELRVAAPQDRRAGVDAAIARWAFDHNQPAGVGTDNLPAAPALYLPLKAPMRVRGVLAIEPASPAALQVPEQREFLDTLAALIAIAIERVHFVTVAQQTLVQMESERLRNSLLAALSHDLRTPLTALVGLADTLSIELGRGQGGPAATARSISDQARRTAELVDNLLEMARLQAGGVTLRRDWQSLEELVGSAIASIEPALADHRIDIAIPPDLPLLHCDGALIERVIVNLLENAAKHTPAGTRIGVNAGVGDGEIEVTVWDSGPGLPPGDPDALFDKFTRGDKESRVPGVGLGLAICRAIVEAHGGRIAAGPRSGGGARFTFTLPLASAPAVEAEAGAEDAA